MTCQLVHRRFYRIGRQTAIGHGACYLGWIVPKLSIFPAFGITAGANPTDLRKLVRRNGVNNRGRALTHPWT
jgi:hypothetical protein